MERTQVESSQIRSVGFDDTEQAMEIEFSTGSVYRYDNVDRETFDGFMASDSKGKFFGDTFKRDPERYPFTKIRPTDREVAKAVEADHGDEADQS